MAQPSDSAEKPVEFTGAVGGPLLGTITTDFDAKLLSGAGEGCLGRNVPLCQCCHQPATFAADKAAGFQG